MIARLFVLVLVPLLATAPVGCSLASSSTQSIAIMPSHPSAEVYVDGALKGKGAQTIELSKKRAHSVMAKCGVSAGVATVDRNLSTTGMLDLIGGFLILFPFIGLVSAGAWELSPTAVSVPVPDATECEAAAA